MRKFGGSIENITGAITLGARNVDKQMHRIVETLNVETEDLRQKQTNLQTFDDSIVTFNDNFEEMEQSLDDMIGNLGQSVACAKRLELASNTSSSHVKDISEDISNLESMSNNITQIVSTIMEISSQTNLLALNASIEAARAGEAGRGFAVVADEIRVLSNSTAQATENISEQITQIQGLITNVVSVLNDSTRDFTANAEESGEVLHLLTNMNESVSRAGQMNQNLKGSLQTFVENKDMIVAMFQSIQENIVTCLDASIEAQESAKMQSETSEQLMSESGRLSELATDFRETTSHFKRV